MRDITRGQIKTGFVVTLAKGFSVRWGRMPKAVAVRIRPAAKRKLRPPDFTMFANADASPVARTTDAHCRGGGVRGVTDRAGKSTVAESLY